MFYLSVAEVEKYIANFIGAETMTVFNPNYTGQEAVKKEYSWWTRSHSDLTTYVYYFRNSAEAWLTDGRQGGIDARPATNINRDDILFTSPAVSGKTLDLGLKEIQNYNGNEWKVTLKDASR